MVCYGSAFFGSAAVIPLAEESTRESTIDFSTERWKPSRRMRLNEDITQPEIFPFVIICKWIDNQRMHKIRL